MRKVAMLMATLAILVLVAATAVYAVNKTCASKPCRGTVARDILYERNGNRVADAIYGLGKGDRINAGTFERDRDQLWGGQGNDRLSTFDDDGRDNLNGGPGTDTCNGDLGADYADVAVNCERGNLAD
jgi:Ca2+-binding RTX toxin-like protein